MLVRLRRLELAGFALRQPGNIWSHPHFWLNPGQCSSAGGVLIIVRRCWLNAERRLDRLQERGDRRAAAPVRLTVQHRNERLQLQKSEMVVTSRLNQEKEVPDERGKEDGVVSRERRG